MNQPAICYVSDLGFLVPTLISVHSLRRFVPRTVPVFLITILDDDSVLNPVKHLLDKLAVTVVPLPKEKIESVAAVWAESHVPVAALGRFFLPELLPPDISRILYIDGDTLVMRDLTPLLETDLPAGKIGMVEDTFSFYRHDQSANGEMARTYFAGLGLPDGARYANSGVFLANREDWKTIAGEALDYMRQNSTKCLYHDQSAINAVVGQRNFALSPRWNYQSRFLQWQSKPVVEPAIFHFTGAAKPWMGRVRPWQDIADQVSAILSELSVGQLPLRVMNASEVEAHNSQYRGVVHTLRRLIDVRQKRRASALRRYQASALF